MGFPFLFVSRLIARGSTKKELPPRAAAVVESLERRVLFDVQINSPVLDAPGTISSDPPVILANQVETTNVTFSPPGSNDRTVVAYNDSAIAQFGQAAGSPMHQTGWSYSNNGGQSFAQPSNGSGTPALLPTVSNGTEATGDDANHSLAWDNANATLYLASTSWPNQSDINVYASTDGGQAFLSGVDATPDAPTADSTTYDKPWLAADNYPGTADGTGYGALYLAYVQNVGNNYNQIVITGLAPGAPFASTSWPTPLNQNTPPGSVLATGNVQSPEVRVEPNHSVDVVYVTGDGIYLVHSDSPLSLNGWANPQHKRLVAFQHTNGGFPFDDLYTSSGKETIATSTDGAETFLSGVNVSDIRIMQS